MPKPKPGESESDFVERCIPMVIREGVADDGSAAAARCHGIYREAKKTVMTIDEGLTESPEITPHDLLLFSVRARAEKSANKFNQGIITADRYVQTLQECVGLDACYRYTSNAQKHVAYSDVLKESRHKLTYNHPDMILEKKFDGGFEDVKLEVPKKTLMVFRHCLTTTRKDRDGDVMRTKGAELDPNMLLLWQHIHTLPIGKSLGVASRDDNKLSMYSAIVDMNPLCHDSATMIDNGMGRFSHGFRAIDFQKSKEEQGHPTREGGFDIKKFEILEESLVSVPANVDAQMEDVLLSLVGNGKLTSGIVKEWAGNVKKKLPARESVLIDVQEENDEDRGTKEKEAGSVEGKGCECGDCKAGRPCSCASKEAEDVDRGKGHEEPAESKEMKTEKMAMYSGMIEGSWEYIEMKLREASKSYITSQGHPVGENEYVTVIATFADYAIICIDGYMVGSDSKNRYYKAFWTSSDGEVRFIGSPEEVEIQTTTEIVHKMWEEKAGRVFSKRSVEKLKEIKEHVEKIHKTEFALSRKGHDRCKACVKLIDEMTKIYDTDDEERTLSDMSVKDLTAQLIEKACRDERDRVVQIFKALNESEKEPQGSSVIRRLIVG